MTDAVSPAGAIEAYHREQGRYDDLFPELPDSVVGHSGYRSP